MPASYHIQLSDGHGWDLLCDDETENWFREFVRILELKPSEPDGSPRLIFTRGDLTSLLNPDNDKSKWRCLEQRMFRIWSKPGSSDLIIDIGRDGDDELETLRMWQATLPIHETVLQTGGIPLHATLIEKDGEAFVLAGPGNTGKSTCARRLSDPWHGLCDDEVLVVKVKDGEYRAHPFPTWSDYLWKESTKSWPVESSYPLRGIFFIKQNKTDDAITLGSGQSAMLLQQSSEQVFEKGWHFTERSEVAGRRTILFNNICEMVTKIPAYILEVSLEGRYWEEIERVMNGTA